MLDKYIQYLDKSVLEEARSRIIKILSKFDDYYVSFSGGKDSLVVLNLFDQIKNEFGIKGKTKVIFRDEEVIPDDVVQFVNDIRLSGKYDLRWYCMQLESEKYILGKKETYIQWDKNRKHIRPIPEFAITSDDVLSQYTADHFCTKESKGKIAILTGIRASESIVRFNSIKGKKNEPYIADSGYDHIKLCKPIYDWQLNDIFKYFYDNQIEYNQIYDKEMWNKDSLRVSTPLHAENAKNIHKLKTIYPTFYAQLYELFPEIEMQARYYKDLDKYSMIERYPVGWNGIFAYINDTITEPHTRAIAMERVIQTMKTRENKLKQYPNTYGGYPMLYVFKQIINGAYKRHLQPVSQVGEKEREYERRYAELNH